MYAISHVAEKDYGVSSDTPQQLSIDGKLEYIQNNNDQDCYFVLDILENTSAVSREVDDNLCCLLRILCIFLKTFRISIVKKMMMLNSMILIL